MLSKAVKKKSARILKNGLSPYATIFGDHVQRAVAAKKRFAKNGKA